MIELIRTMSPLLMILTGLAITTIKVQQKVTLTRFVVGSLVVSALGFVAASFMFEPDSPAGEKQVNPWAVLVCGLCIYALVHTLEINGTSGKFKLVLFMWSGVIALAAWLSGLGLDSGVSLVAAVFFDYVMKYYESWLLGNPARAYYEEEKEFEAQENLKRKKVLKHMNKRHEIPESEYRIARHNLQRVYSEKCDNLYREYLENYQKEEGRQRRNP